MIKEIAARLVPAPKQELLAFLKNLLAKVYNRHYYEKWGKIDSTLGFEEWQSSKINLILSKVTEKDSHYSLLLPKLAAGWIIRKYITRSREDTVDGHYGDVDTEKFIDTLNTLFSNFGVYVNSYRQDYRGWNIALSPMRDKPVTVPKYLYTFSPLQNKLSILRKGLIPKVSKRADFSYPARIFLFTKYNKSNIAAMKIALQTYGEEAEDIYYGRVNIMPIIVFRVDTSKLPNKFYVDGDSVIGGKLTAVWTPTHIPPTAISIKYEDVA